MDEEELARVELDLYQIADALGQPEVLDNRLYRQRPPASEGAPETLLPIRERLREKIFTLDRLLSLHDRTTYEMALRNFRVAAERSQYRPASEAVVPQSAFLVHDNGEREDLQFSELPDLTNTRALLRSLIEDMERR